MTPGFAQPREQLPWLYYPESDRVIINAHNFTRAFSPAVNGKTPFAAWIPTRSQNAEDIVGSNDGTLTNGASVVTNSGAGGTHAFSFDGINDYVLVPNLSAMTAWTISCWSYSTSTIPYPSPVCLKLGTLACNGIVGELTQWKPIRNDSYAANKGGTRIENVWQHLLVTWTGTVLSLYVDNVIGASGAAGSGWGITDSRIGDGYSTQEFKGFIDDVRIWNSVLDSSDRAHLYASGSGRGVTE